MTGLVDAEALVTFDARARALAAAFWPGALTLVLPRKSDCPVNLLAGAGLDTLAIRVPAHDAALALIEAAGRPIAAPSANLSGSVSPTTAQHVAASLGDRVDLILDGGPCAIGLESTVLDLSGKAPAILRPGGVTAEQIVAVTGPLLSATENAAAPKSPGQLDSHYATAAPLRLDATSLRPGETLLAFGPDAPDGAAHTENLSPSADLTEAAANLFAMMRRLDARSPIGIAVMPVPMRGLGIAINDRLRRAAHAAPLAGKQSIS